MIYFVKSDHQRLSSIKGLQFKVAFHWRLSSILDHLWSRFILYSGSKFVSHRRLSSIQGLLISKFDIQYRLVVLHQLTSSIECCHPSKIHIHKRSSFIISYLPLKGVPPLNALSIKGCLTSRKGIFHQRLSSI